MLAKDGRLRLRLPSLYYKIGKCFFFLNYFSLPFSLSMIYLIFHIRFLERLKTTQSIKEFKRVELLYDYGLYVSSSLPTFMLLMKLKSDIKNITKYLYSENVKYCKSIVKIKLSRTIRSFTVKEYHISLAISNIFVLYRHTQ